MKNLTITILIVCCFQSKAFAQTDSLQIDGAIGIRGKWQTGNFAQFVINPNARIGFEKKRTLMELKSNYELLRVNQGNLINDFWSFGIYQYHSNKTIFPIAIAHFGFAESYAIDKSLVGGVGAGINIIKRNRRKYLQANIFLGYINLKYKNTMAHSAPSSGSYIKLGFPLKEGLIYFTLDIHAYMSLKDIIYNGFNNRMIITFQVLKNFGLNLSYRLVHNNNAPTIIKETNGQLVFGLNYTFN